MKKLFENWNKFINEMEVPGGNLPDDHPSREVPNKIRDTNPAVGALLDQMAKRMLSAYTDEVPPALDEMIDFINARDYETIRSGHNRMWTDLIQYHRDTGVKLQPQVSHNFRNIRTIVTNM